MIRCAAHYGGWCSIEIGIGVGGGCGLFFFLSVGCRIRNPPDNRLPNDGRRETHTFLCSCLSVKQSDCSLHTNWIILRRFRNQVVVGLFLTLLFCLPWLIGVVIRGGVLACVTVLPAWIFVFIIILVTVRNEHRE